MLGSLAMLAAMRRASSLASSSTAKWLIEARRELTESVDDRKKPRPGTLVSGLS
jgi:hypothetical protein